MSSLEAHGIMWVNADIFDIDRRIKYGDESGWRGDPTMGLFFNPELNRFEVWGIDRGGTQYIAASHHELSHEILIKLRNGDPTRNDPWQRIIDHNTKVKKEQETADRERRAEVFDKLAWAARQDFGHLYGGRRRQWHIEKGESQPVAPTEGAD